MGDLTNKEFIEFIKSHTEFYKRISEISENDNGKALIKYDSGFKMYSLDEMCWDCKVLEENTPKTTDALFYKQTNYGRDLTLYLIEFKFHNFNAPNAKDLLKSTVKELDKAEDRCVSPKNKKNLHKINNYYGDEVEFSLILKPIESLNIVIPTLYEEYCKKEGEEVKDIRKFLRNIKKKVIVFVSHYDNKKGHNKSKQRLQTMDVGLRDKYRRLEQGKIINGHEIYEEDRFNYFLNIEGLKT